MHANMSHRRPLLAQKWLKSYLKDRKQLVQIDDCASTFKRDLLCTTMFNFGTKTVYSVHK